MISALDLFSSFIFTRISIRLQLLLLLIVLCFMRPPVSSAMSPGESSKLLPMLMCGEFRFLMPLPSDDFPLAFGERERDQKDKPDMLIIEALVFIFDVFSFSLYIVSCSGPRVILYAPIRIFIYSWLNIANMGQFSVFRFRSTTRCFRPPLKLPQNQEPPRHYRRCKDEVLKLLNSKTHAPLTTPRQSRCPAPRLPRFFRPTSSPLALSCLALSLLS